MTEHTGMAIKRLTQGQIECLLLVQQHLTSKEIATRLGISPHTVDQRVRLALRTLGCRSRFHAARLLSAEHSPAAMFQWGAASNEPYVEQFRPRSKGRRGSLPLPFATSGNPINEMSVALRLLWILVIACGAAFSMGLYLAGLESLARLIQGS
jgi:DNA-binding CsgD family transcriptional regulator